MSSSCFLEDTQLPVFTIKVQTQIFILYITGPGLVFIIDPEAFSTSLSVCLSTFFAVFISLLVYFLCCVYQFVCLLSLLCLSICLSTFFAVFISLFVYFLCCVYQFICLPSLLCLSVCLSTFFINTAKKVDKQTDKHSKESRQTN
jgi:hypothetical protein